MKKALAMALAMVMTMGLFAGCGSSNTTSSSDVSTDSSDAANGEKNLKIALLIPGMLGDKSFFDGANAAVPQIESELGATVKVVEMGTDQTKWYPAMVDFCEEAEPYDLIMTISNNIDEVLKEVADEYPKQRFVNLDSEYADLAPNVYEANTRSNEMSFLAGVAAALKAEELGENIIGFMGGLDIPGINQFLVGYIDGAQKINPDIKVVTSYVGSFTDPSKAKENAILMYTNKNAPVSIIYAAAGQSGLGVIDAARENGKFVVGVDSDQAMVLKESNPENAARIITSAVKKADVYAVDVVKRFVAGDLPFGTKEMLGLKEGAVGIAKNEYYEALLSEEARAKIEEMEQQLLDGTLTCIVTEGMTTEELNSIRESVRP